MKKNITEEFLTLAEIRRNAEKKLPREIWDYISGGSDTETTLRKNTSAMKHYEFIPKVLQNVSNIDTSTNFLKIPLALPVMIAPMASLHLIHSDGDLAMARAAGRMGTIHWLSTRTAYMPEDVQLASSGPLIFQLFFRGTNDWCEKLITKIEKLGYKALALTVDTPAYGRRERDLENRYNHRTGPRGIELPMDRNFREASLTWKDVDWLRKKTKLPFILKGIQNIEDAKLAVEHGVDAIYISNHGGRQLDYAPATIELLDEVVRKIGKKTEVIVDSGFTRGTDILKAIALGAKAVCIGKVAAWGLAAGEEGVVQTLKLIDMEMRIAMANTGRAKIRDITPSLVRKISYEYV